MVKRKKNKIDWRIVVMAMGCITVLEIYALYSGINGVLLSATLATLATMAGVAIPTPKFMRRK